MMTNVQDRLASYKGQIFSYEERESLFAKRLEEISAELTLPNAPKCSSEESYHFSFFTPRFSWDFDEEKAKLIERGGMDRALHIGRRIRSYLEYCHDFFSDESFFELAVEICGIIECEEAILVPSVEMPEFVQLVKIVLIGRMPEVEFSPYKSELRLMEFDNHMIVFARCVEKLSPLYGNGEISPKKAIIKDLEDRLRNIENLETEDSDDEVSGSVQLPQQIAVEEDRYTISKEVAAKALGISEKTLTNWVSESKKSGAEFDWVKRVNGSRWVIVRDLFEEWLRSRESKKKGRPMKGLKAPR
jgi:hypothetical protein